jgi:PST family polysaccharide transporter
MNLLKSIAIRKNYKLFENFFYLSISQGINVILPLVTFPYLVRILGIDGFGLISFVNVFMSYFSLVTDYGFNITGVREISLNRGNLKKINEIFNSIMIIKLLLVVVCFIIYLILVLFVDKFNTYKYIYIVTYGTVIGQVLYPNWFFQGIERMKIITVLNVISKLIFTLGIFIFVKTKDDILIVQFLNSMGYIIIALISLIIILKKYGIVIQLQSIQSIKHYLIDSWFIFISNISVTLYTSSTTLILGFLTNNATVGYFSIANKSINVIRSLLDPFSNVLFPYLSNLLKDGKKKVFQINKIILKVGLLFIVPICILIFCYGRYFLSLVFKVHEYRVLVNLRVLSIIPILIIFHIVYGLFTMILLGENKAYSKIIISAGFISIPLSYFLIYNFKDIGASIGIVIIEIYILIRYLLYYKKFVQ